MFKVQLYQIKRVVGYFFDAIGVENINGTLALVSYK